MNTRFVLGYLAFCAALTAYGSRGVSGVLFYAIGLVLCLLACPVQAWLEKRRAFAEGLKQFERDAMQARQLAVQQYHVGGNLSCSKQ